MLSKAEVVVSGIGGIFPKANNLDEFTKILLENVNTAEHAKWVENENGSNTMYNNMPEKRHLLFDATYFGLHRAQTYYLDPMTRLFLEKTFEAVIDAGVNPVELRGKNIPVLIGSTISETETSVFKPIYNGFGVTGQARCMMSNRVSYWLSVNGPSVSVDDNWNCGVQVIEQAVSMIENGICDSAIVGATNLSLGPNVHWLLQAKGLIAEDGKTKAFDEQAEGYSRGDGIVVLYLQRADLAKRNYATVLYASTILNGNRPGGAAFSECDADHLYDFLKKCYEDSGVKPEDIAYLETYGCGVKDIDEQELSAVERLFCKNRTTPLQIGSVKTNIGHTEPVSGLMSLIKIIVAMETGIIPAHLNYKQPNTKIPALTNGKLEVVTKNKPWTGDIAAVNCIGLASSYGHMIVRSNKQPKLDIQTDLPLLLTYSTRTEEGIEKITENVKLLSTDLSFCKLANDAFSSNISGHLYRGFTVKCSTNKTGFQHFSGHKPSVWFVYSGMGSQWHTMGRDLMKLPIFAEAIYKCHNILKSKGVDLLKIITDDDPKIFENILNSFVGIAAVQIGLTDVLNAVGIHPDGIIGHSVGELGCAYADKCLTTEQMILSAYYRGKASLDADLTVGMMAAIGMGYSKLKNFCPESIDIACHNSHDSCTISGPVEDVQKFVGALKNNGEFAKLVNVSNIAYHSRYIKPAAPLLLSYLKDVIPEPKVRSSKWISTSVPESNWHTDLARTVSPEYLTNNLLSSVHFEEGLPFIGDNAVAIEIAPHGLLQAILKRALPKDVANIALTKRDTNCLEFLFNSLGELYLNGVNCNLSPLYPNVPLPVPSGTRSLCSFVEWEHGEEWIPMDVDIIPFTLTERTFDVNLNSKEYQHLSHYQIDNRVFVPPTLYFEFINEIIMTEANLENVKMMNTEKNLKNMTAKENEVINKERYLKNITYEEVVFLNHVEVPADGTISITIMIQFGTQVFEVFHNRKILITGKIIRDDGHKLPPAEAKNNKELANINEYNFYKELNIQGYKFQDEHKLVNSIIIKENGFRGTAKCTDDWKAFVSTMLQMHLFYKGESSQEILIPKYIQRINISFDDVKDTEKESTIWFNSQTRILESNKGVHITGIEYGSLKTVETIIKMENLKFMKHLDENIADVRFGLEMCMKIVTNNLGTRNLTITELKETNASKYLPYFEKYLIQDDFDAKAIEINEIDYTVLNESSLTIISGKFLNVASRIISNANKFFLLCFPNNHAIYMSNKYSTIAQFSANNTKFYLLKKTSVNPVKVINVKDNKLSYKNMQTNSNPWTTELKTMSRNENSRIYLVSRSIPVEGIEEFVTQMQKIGYNGQFLRFMFVLDPSAPECKPGEEFYARVFEQDLIVQVLKNGTWGSFVDMYETPKSNTNSLLMRTLNLDGISNICKVQYLGIHVKDLTRIDDDSIPSELGAVDFTGTNAAGDRLMGLAQTDLKQRKMATDPAFVWTVPTNWSLCDAATVPYAYTMAYYTLFTVGNISKGDVVLVHAGCSDIGQAALHVAYNYGCTVYTTVATDQQKIVLKKLLPQMKDDNILNSETTQFELSILIQTKGRGVDVILNCLPGERLHASTQLIAPFGRFIQMGTADMNQHATIGMKFFLQNVSFYGITGQNLLRLQQEDKQQLQEMISKDIKRGVVKPIARKIFTENRMNDSLRYLRSSNVLGAVVMQVNRGNYKKPAVINQSLSQFSSKETYLIYADSQDSWIFLVKWLVKGGPRRIIIANLTNQIQDYINRYLTITKQIYDTDIIITKHNAYTLDNAKILANEVSLFGSPTETFIFAMGDGEHHKIFENIDIAFSKNKLNGRMVCILGTNKEKSYFRVNGLPVCNVMWESTYNLEDVIKNFDVILTKEDNTTVLLKDDVIVNEDIIDDAVIAEDDSMFLPNSLKTLKQLGQNELKAACLVQLASFAPSEVRETPPVFLVPGLGGPHCPQLRQLLARLMHPVFCVHLPAQALHDDVVPHLANLILQAYQSKIYKLIGISWGGILAIEIAKQLENLGKKIELQLVDGSPRIIQNFTSNFNKTGVFNTTLLKQVIKVDNQNMETILSSANLSKFDYKDIIKSLTVLKNLIEYSNFYKPLPNKINGPTTVILPETASTEESLGLTEFCDQIRFKIMRGNHRSILENTAAIDFINDNLM